VYGAWRLLMLDGDSLILSDVMMIGLLYVLSYHDTPLIRLIIVWVLLLHVYFDVTSMGLLVLFVFYLIGCKIGFW
jgi:hypothetical protein